MDPNENTKSGPKQMLGQNVGHVEQESPRTCKVCGGPNHYGCGCEARARRRVGMVEDKDLKTTEQPEPEKEDDLEDVFSPEAIKESAKSNRKMAQDIETIAEGLDSLNACVRDTFSYIEGIHNMLQERMKSDASKNKN